MKKLLSLLLTFVLCLLVLAPDSVGAATIKISQKTALVVKGDYLYLSIKGTTTKATWSSNNKYVATVSKTGKVTTNGTGKATITAKIKGIKYSCKVTVIPKIDPDYMTDTDLENAIAERDAIDKWTSTDSLDDSSSIITPTISPTDRNLDGIETPSTTEDESSEYGKTPEWIGNKYLSDVYDITINWSGTKTYLIYGIGESYIVTGTPSGKFEAGKIYEGKYNGHTIRFKYEDEILINAADLNTAGIIKIK
jgi:hypothetical protein